MTRPDADQLDHLIGHTDHRALTPTEHAALRAGVQQLRDSRAEHAEADRDAAIERAELLQTQAWDYRQRILDIDAHATPYGVRTDDPEGNPRAYLVTVGSLHRALGTVGHTAPKCDAEARAERYRSAWRSARRRAAEARCIVADYRVETIALRSKAAGVPLICSDERHAAKVTALQQRYDDEHATAVTRAHDTDHARRQLAAAEARITAVRALATEYATSEQRWDADAVGIGEELLAALDGPADTPAAVPSLDGLDADALTRLIHDAQHRRAILDPDQCPAECAEGHTYEAPCSGYYPNSGDEPEGEPVLPDEPAHDPCVWERDGQWNAACNGCDEAEHDGEQWAERHLAAVAQPPAGWCPTCEGQPRKAAP